jgi:hypothetical protein
MTQTELQNELDKLKKKALSLSKKAYCGSDHSSLYSGSMQVIYDRIWQLKAQLNNQ